MLKRVNVSLLMHVKKCKVRCGGCERVNPAAENGSVVGRGISIVGVGDDVVFV